MPSNREMETVASRRDLLRMAVAGGVDPGPRHRSQRWRAPTRARADGAHPRRGPEDPDGRERAVHGRPADLVPGGPHPAGPEDGREAGALRRRSSRARTPACRSRSSSTRPSGTSSWCGSPATWPRPRSSRAWSTGPPSSARGSSWCSATARAGRSRRRSRGRRSPGRSAPSTRPSVPAVSQAGPDPDADDPGERPHPGEPPRQRVAGDRGTGRAGEAQGGRRPLRHRDRGGQPPRVAAARP